MSCLPTDDFPVSRLRKATTQVVQLGSYYDGDTPFQVVVNAIYVSKNFGPLYSKDARQPDILYIDPGVNRLTLDEYDTDTPGMLNVQLLCADQYLQFWFEVIDE